MFIMISGTYQTNSKEDMEKFVRNIPYMELEVVGKVTMIVHEFMKHQKKIENKKNETKEFEKHLIKLATRGEPTMTLTKKIEEDALITAINTFMSDWDCTVNAENFMKQMGKNDIEWEEVSGEPWEPFEYHTPNQVAEYIDSLYKNIIYIFKGVK